MSTVDRRLSTASNASTSSMSGDYSSHSVQELFEKFSIQEIQKLNRNYQQQVAQSTDALQLLVSHKYRDLIAITDEISETYQMTNELETQLSDLAYRRAKFVSFNTPNAFSQLQLSMLTKEMEKVRRQERFQILNQVVFGKLLHFDLAISGNTTPLLHTSNYIYCSKSYYILESVFGDDILQKKGFQKDVTTMKKRFNNLLESHLASFNLSCASLYTSDSDKFYQSQHFSTETLLPKTQTPVLEDTELDLEEIIEDSGTVHPDHEYEDLLPEQYNKNTLSIVNYLVAYVILNSHDSQPYTIGRTLLRLLKLRFEFLESLLDQTLEKLDSTNVNHISFFSIFKFIENTMGYLSTYFAKRDPQNAFTEQLNQATNSWNSNKLLGIDNWIDEKVLFNMDLFNIDIPQSTLEEMNQYHHKFISLISSFYTKVVNFVGVGNSIDSVSNHFYLLSNLITGLKRLESFCSNNEFQSQLILLLSTGIENPIIKGLEETVNRISQIHGLHLDELDKDNGIIDRISSSLQDHSYADEKLNLFSSDLVDIIDEDLTKYFNMIKQASVDKCFSFESGSIMKTICRWFESSSKFYKQLSLEQVEVSERPNAFLIRMSEYLLKDESKWGKFSKSLLSERFEEVKIRLNSQLWKKLSDFMDRLGCLLEENIKKEDTQNVYYLLSIVHVLKDQVRLMPGNSSEDLIKKLNDLSHNTFEYMIRVIPSTKSDSVSFYDQFEATFDIILSEKDPNEDLVESISLRLETLMFHLASLFLQPLGDDYESDYKSGLLFIPEEGAKPFAEVKNKWIQEELINKRIMSRLSEVKVNKKTFTAVSSAILFLNCLIGSTQKKDYDDLSKFCQEEVDQEELTVSANSIIEAYKMSMNTYFPLNA